MGTATTETRCGVHLTDRAGWTCQACQRDLCPRCAVRRRAGTGWVVACLHCGGYGAPILVPRARASYAALLPGALVYPFTRNGLLVLAATGVVFAFLARLGALASLLGSAALASYLFAIVRTTAVGEEDVPEPDDFTHPWELVSALLRATVATLLSVVPFAVYVLALKTRPAAEGWAELALAYATDPLLYVSLALGLLWVPIALVLAATNTGFLTVVNPWAALLCIRRLGFDYVLAAAAFWGMTVVSVLLGAFGATFEALADIPILPSIVAEIVSLYAPFVYARVLGLLLYVRGAELGYGTAREHYEPVLGDVLPPEESAIVPVLAQAEGAGPGLEVSAELAASLRASPPRGPVFDADIMPKARPELLSGHVVDPPTPPRAPPLVRAAPPARRALREDLVSEEQFAETVHRTATPAPRPSAPPAPRAPAPAGPLMIGGPGRPDATPSPRAAPPSPPTDEQVISLAQASQWPALAAAYRARLGAVTCLSAEQLVAIAGVALETGDVQTASHALRRAGFDHASSRVAPDALLRAARLFRDRLKKAGEAKQLLQHVARTYPDTTAGAEAKRDLAAAG